MNIALIGFGKMGNLVRDIAAKQGHQVVIIIDPQAEGATAKEISSSALREADACIEFSVPEVVVENIKKVSALKKPHVVATTGWYKSIDAVKAVINKSGTGLIYGSNFSLGVNAFFAILENAASIMDKLPEYDVFGYEVHHNRKADSPSGTAKTIEQALLANIARKKKVVEEKLDRKIAPDEIHFASVRGGDVPGTHVVCFDAPADTIELKHTARTREGFALGAIKAAQWIIGKKGFFSVQDMMKELIKGKGGK